jgi:glycosyltransferase involved in cell wall biosynthesis
MTISCIAVTSNSDLPETHLFIGLWLAGIDLEVMCPLNAPHRQLLINAGIPVTDLVLTSRIDRGGINRIKARLLAHKPAILHAFNNKAVSNSLFASKGLNLSFIAYRGIEGNVSYYDPMSWTTYLHPRVDAIVCVANAIRDYFLNMRLLGIKRPVKKALTIYKGHRREWYEHPGVDLKQWGISEGAFVVACTVNDRPRKGLDQLIAATALLPNKVPNKDIHIVLIGQISNVTLLQQIKDSAFRENIHLLGFQTNAHAIVKNCDVCILPAVKREGLPKGIIEGMIQGVAPIVTNSGGSPELIEDNVSGQIIPPRSPEAIADAILAYYNNREWLQSVKENAIKRIVNCFPTEKTIEQHLDLYLRLIAKRQIKS